MKTKKWLVCFMQSINSPLLINEKIVLEVRQAQCSHPDVHSSKLEDILIEDF